MAAPRSIEDFYDQIMPEGGYAALEKMLQQGGPDLDAVDPKAVRLGAELARDMMRTPGGAAFMDWLMRQVVMAASFELADEAGRPLTMDQIAARGLYLEGQKHLVRLIVTLAEKASDFEEETAHENET